MRLDMGYIRRAKTYDRPIKNGAEAPSFQSSGLHRLGSDDLVVPFGGAGLMNR